MDEPTADRLILVIEDNLEHARSIEAAFQASAVPHQLIIISDGLQAIDFLWRRGSYSDAPRPDLILLDLNLPEKSGKELLAEIKSDGQLKRIPIVVLTLSDAEADILGAYKLQGNCYVIKPEDLDQLVAIVKRIEEFWLGIVTLPGE